MVILFHSRVGTVAPISKKAVAGSAGKSGAGFGRTASFFGAGKSGKSGNVFGSSGKSGASLGASRKSTIAFGSSPKYADSAGKSNAIGKMAAPIGGQGKHEKSTSPLLVGSSTSKSSPFVSTTNKSTPPTSYSSPKKSSTSFGIVWLPIKRHNKKKDYVHVSNRYEGQEKDKTSSMYHFMSGDSPSHLPNKKRDDEKNLLVLERPKGPIATAASAGAVVITADSAPSQDAKEDKADKHTSTDTDKEESKEAAGDTTSRDDDDYLDNETIPIKLQGEKYDSTEKVDNDKVDSIYLRPPPPHKVRSNTSSADEEDCGIKCLYYTLQCCDCVLM